MTDRRNTPENTANDTIQSPFPQYSPKMPEMEENPTVQPHFADFGLTSAPNEQIPQKPLFRGFLRHLQAILPLNTDKASNKRRIAQITPSAHCYASKRRILRAFPRLFEHFGKLRYTSADILPSSGAISSRFCPVSPRLDRTALSRRILNFPSLSRRTVRPKRQKAVSNIVRRFSARFSASPHSHILPREPDALSRCGFPVENPRIRLRRRRCYK